MGFLQKLFRRKKQKEVELENEDWQQPVYVRDEIDFRDREQRNRYIEGCLEQIAEATREVNLLTGEYSLVTSYLTDMEEIEALPEEEREEINRVASKLLVLDKERQAYQGRKKRMEDWEYRQMRKQEKEVEEGISKIKESEKYNGLVKQDLQRLNGERHAYEYRRAELENILANLKGMAVIFLSALFVCIILLMILQFGFEMDTKLGSFVAVTAGAISIMVLSVKYTDTDRERRKVEKAINKIIQLQNKVKIRYVNNINLLDYLYMKYNTDSGEKLLKRWKAYLKEREERRQFAEAEAKTEYYQKELVKQLSRYRVRNPERWINQAAALLDKREMVEIRHDLILRRQALRKQLDYNNDVADSARNEIKDVSQKYPAYADEILQIVGSYNVKQA